MNSQSCINLHMQFAHFLAGPTPFHPQYWPHPQGGDKALRRLYWSSRSGLGCCPSAACLLDLCVLKVEGIFPSESSGCTAPWSEQRMLRCPRALALGPAPALLAPGGPGTCRARPRAPSAEPEEAGCSLFVVVFVSPTVPKSLALFLIS